MWRDLLEETFKIKLSREVAEEEQPPPDDDGDNDEPVFFVGSFLLEELLGGGRIHFMFVVINNVIWNDWSLHGNNHNLDIMICTHSGSYTKNESKIEITEVVVVMVFKWNEMLSFDLSGPFDLIRIIGGY